MAGFWSSETLRQLLPDLIEHYEPERVKHCSYEMCLGDAAYVTNRFGSSLEQQELDINLDMQDRVVIPPGQFALLITEEKIRIPDNALGFISIRSGAKLRGLVNVSGFHVDPGYEGKLIFGVFNAASSDIVISRGQNIFLLWYASLDSRTKDNYIGEHQGRTGIRDDEIMNLHGPAYNPTALAARLKTIEDLDPVSLEARVRSLEDRQQRRTKWRDRWQNLSLRLVSRVVIALVLLAGSALLGATIW